MPGTWRAFHTWLTSYPSLYLHQHGRWSVNGMMIIILAENALLSATLLPGQYPPKGTCPQLPPLLVHAHRPAFA